MSPCCYLDNTIFADKRAEVLEFLARYIYRAPWLNPGRRSIRNKKEQQERKHLLLHLYAVLLLEPPKLNFRRNSARQPPGSRRIDHVTRIEARINYQHNDLPTSRQILHARLKIGSAFNSPPPIYHFAFCPDDLQNLYRFPTYHSVQAVT